MQNQGYKTADTKPRRQTQGYKNQGYKNQGDKPRRQN